MNEELLNALAETNQDLEADGEEHVTQEQLQEAIDDAVESLLEDVFSGEKIYRKIDRFYDSGEYYNYDAVINDKQLFAMSVIEATKEIAYKKGLYW